MNLWASTIDVTRCVVDVFISLIETVGSAISNASAGDAWIPLVADVGGLIRMHALVRRRRIVRLQMHRSDVLLTKECLSDVGKAGQVVEGDVGGDVDERTLTLE